MAQSRPVAIRNATVFPVAGPPLAAGVVVFAQGRITAVGEAVALPPEADVVDATGLFLLPGLIDTHSHLGVGSWPSVPAHSDVTESSEPLTPHARVADAFNVDDPAIRRVVAAGVTTIQVFPGSANVIGGEGLVVKLKAGRPLEEMIFPGAPRLMKMAVGENPKAAHGRHNRMPATRMGIAALLRDALTSAKEYRDSWDRWTSAPPAARGPAPARDARLEALADVLRGRVRVHVHCYRRDEFLTLLRLADEFGFRIASFQHAMESYKVAEELARRGVAVSVYPDAFGRKIEHWEQIPQNAAFLHASGVLVALHSDFPFFAQRLHVEAAKLLRYGGISEADALRTITVNAARLIGIEREVGTLEPGKQADLVLFDRHPFDSFARVERTYIDGELVYDRRRDRAWFERGE
jgi:imidazolonepropionase-like amidohydrolase